jgi:predicted RNase H-like HicB family nuclease
MARYSALIDGEAGAYGVIFPDLPGCTAMGATIDQAIVNAVAAMRDWVEVTLDAGEKTPTPTPIEALRKDPDVRRSLAEGASLASVPLIRETGKPTKANLSIDSSLLEAIDQEAKRLALTRSKFVEMIVRRTLPQLG